ncbi:methyltransferase domain-containing protein [Aquifex aeolicus]|uniref:Methyltransferase type 11 domain-containing protein n=1 Tax=Aquifex aeolicus (strain VF5) TaxID=224324 RepID=O67896_AQUAE|nr:methyltransferase domain-containing protein [Aquifex aeolicus]AAC07859.1 putative protein [Aquifex aeolicus VF5]
MKNTLGRQFSRATETYEKWAVPQRKSAKILVEFVKPSGLVLDLGCGTGFVSEFVNDCEVVGLDISEGMAKAYREKFRKVVIGNAENLPFKDRSFDFVLSNFSLHWSDWRKSIREALRVCKNFVGVAIPVYGSVSFSEFPFPKAEEILEEFKPQEFKIINLEIPFRGMELIKFFHYTGTANFTGKKNFKTKRELIKLSKDLEKEYFKVLFLKLKSRAF